MLRKLGVLLCLLALAEASALPALRADYSHCYRSGYSYWPGGHWCGGGGYGAGYYKAGYYRSYAAYYESPVLKPYFVRYLAVLPLAELPTYGAYAETAKATPAAAPAAMPPAAPAATSSLEAKLDRVLALSEQTLNRVGTLEQRVSAVEARVGIAPAPAGGPPAAPRAAGADAPDVPTMLHAACARCHEAKVAAKLGKRFVCFADGPDGAEMAKLGPDGKPAQLARADLQKMRDQLAKGKMPPETDAEGHPVKPMSEADRKRAVAFLDEALKNAK